MAPWIFNMSSATHCRATVERWIAVKCNTKWRPGFFNSRERRQRVRERERERGRERERRDTEREREGPETEIKR